MEVAYFAEIIFVDKQETSQKLVVSRNTLPHLLQEAADLIDDFEMPRQQRAEER